jgi:ligand-binding sensor domain-containing protein
MSLKGGNGITDIAMDGQGRLWFARGSNGVSRYDGTQWADYTVQDGLANDQVHSILADRQGHLWFGTISGISRLDLVHFDSFTTRDGLVHDGVMSLLADRQGHLWVGTFQGVSRYDGAGFTAIGPLAG